MKFIKTSLLATVLVATAAASSAAPTQVNASKLKQIRKALNNGTTTVNLVDAIEFKNSLNVNSDFTITTERGNNFQFPLTPRNRLKETAITASDSTLRLQNLGFEDFEHGVLATSDKATIITDNAIFRNNTDGGVLSNVAGSKLKVLNSGLFHNSSTENGGALNNDGKSSVIYSYLRYNSAVNGGAINNTKKLTVKRSTFRGNEATENGGAINNTDRLTVKKSFFRENTALNGGAINNTGKATVKSSRFTGNTATGNGGAIHNSGDLTLDYALFRENTAKNGAAIWSEGTLNITDSRFLNNTSEDAGGAVNSDGDLVVDYSLFRGNSAQTGGAINTNGIADIQDSRFIENTATGNGGALNIVSNHDEDVYNYINYSLFQDNKALEGTGGAINNTGALAAYSSRFLGNSATGNGGAINHKSARSSDVLTIRDGLFEDNVSLEGNGGALANSGTAYIIDSNVRRNSGAYGGAVYSQSGHFGTENSLYEYNTASNAGGAIMNSSMSTLQVVNGRFFNNTVANEIDRASVSGGAIYNAGYSYGIDGRFFDNSVTNYSSSFGGAIYNGGAKADIKSVTGVFSGNHVVTEVGFAYGGAITNYTGGATIDSIDARFIGNYAKSTGTSAARGGAIFNLGTISEITGVFANNYTKSDKVSQGGAIYNAVLDDEKYNTEGYLKIVDATFYKNGRKESNNKIMTKEGGAIYNAEGTTLKIDETRFVKNAATNAGGAIYNMSDDFTVYNSVFNSNKSKDVGGAIYNASSYTIAENGDISYGEGGFMKGNVITENKARNDGGALYNASGSIEIQNTTFRDNRAKKGSGGAIYTDVNAETRLFGSVVVGNKAKLDGGAIYNIGKTTIGSTGNGDVFTVFRDNESRKASGGAIHNEGDLYVQDAIFASNTAKFDGGAINNVSEQSLTIRNALFNGNVARKGNGGALYNTGTTHLIDTSFVGNIAKNGYGGAIFNKAGGSLHISNSEFLGNTAEMNGGAINNVAGARLNITNTTFRNNVAKTTKGGAINNVGVATITDSSFYANEATKGKGGAISNEGTLTIKSVDSDVIFRNNTDENGESNAIHNFASGHINLLASSRMKIEFNDALTGNGSMSIGDDNHDGKIILNADTSEYTGAVTLNNGILVLDRYFDGYTNIFSNFTTTGGRVNTANRHINTVDASDWNIMGQLSVVFDVNLRTLESDFFTGIEDSNIKISRVEIMDKERTSGDEINIQVADKDNAMILSKDGALAYGDIFAYDVTSDKLQSDGILTFNRNSRIVNPEMTKTRAASSAIVAGVTDATKITSPISRGVNLKGHVNTARNSASGDNYKSMIVSTWAEAYYASDEVDLEGLTIDNDSYFTIMGADIAGADLGLWSSLYSVYTGYIGSNQNYSGVEIDQNGLIVGASLALENDNWYTVFNSNGTFNFLDSQSSSGTDEFNMFSLSIANTTGVKLYVPSSVFFFEPNLTAGYHFVHTEDYVSASGVNIESDGLHIFNIIPEIKVGLDLEGFFKPYVSAAYNWNFETGGDVTANDVLLPNLSVDEYAELRLGADFEFEGGFDAFIEGQASLGDRDGFGVQAGIKWNF